MTALPRSAAELADWTPEIESPVWDRFPEATAANAQEVYPGVGDPLSFDINMTAIEHGIRTVAERMGLTKTMGLDEWPHLGFFAAYYGHAFINIAAFREFVKWIPRGDPDAMEEQLFGLTRDRNAGSWTPSPRHQLVRLRTLIKIIPMIRAFPGELAANNEAVEAYLQKIQSADLDAMTDRALMRELDEAYRRNLVVCEIHAMTVLGGGAFENLRVFLRDQGFDDIDARLARLCTGLDNIESAKPGRELSLLARRIRESAKLTALFKVGDAETVLAALRASDDPEVAAFRRGFDTFLRTYGYRGVRELGLPTQVWATRPDSVIGVLQSYTSRQDTPDAAQTLQEQARVRKEETEFVLARLSGRDRKKFRGVLKAAHEGIAARELAKSQWARSTHGLRLLVREIGRRLAGREVISEPDDVYYLRLPELKDAMAGQPHPDLRPRIARRRAELKLCEGIETAERFTGRPIPQLRGVTPQETAGAAGGTVLRGIPVSPGRVTAPARVVRELTDEIDLEPGEVLVCPFTDAAWTPLFFNAAAVVMDLGGPLSHGSTVAREYGLPAVVNVKTGTEQIRTGQMLTVDGTKGEVVVEQG